MKKKVKRKIAREGRCKRIFALALGLTLFLNLHLSANMVIAKPVDEYLKAARDSFAQGKLQATVGQCSRAIELDPKNSEAFQMRGWATFCMGKPGPALVDLNVAVNLNPKRYENLTSKAEVLRQLEKYDDSRKILDQAVKVNPSRPDAYYLRGLTCLLQGLHVRAKQDFTDAINHGKGNPYLAYAYYWRGRTAEMREDYKAAVLDFSESIRMDPEIEPEFIGYEHSGAAFVPPIKEKRECPLGLLERGLSYSSLGEHAKAIEDLTLVIKASPKETLLYEKRGSAYLFLGKYSNALNDFNKALLLGTESGDVYYHLGLAHFCLKRYDSAAADFSAWLGRTFWQDDAKTPLVAMMTYASYKLAGKPDKAVKLAAESTKGMTKAFGWVKSIPSVLNGKFSPDQLVSSAESKPLKDKTQAHCYAGLYFLAEGKAKEALKQFSWASTQGDRKLHEYTISTFEVKQLSTANK